MLKAVHHIGITVEDLDRAIEFYGDCLGIDPDIPPTPTIDAKEVGDAIGVPSAVFRVGYLAIGGVLLEFVEYTEPPSPIKRPVPSNAIGSQHLAFRVDDVRAVVARLQSKGIEFFSDVNVVDEGPLKGWRWVYFADPDGNSIELVELAAD